MDWKNIENYPNTWKWIWFLSLATFLITITSHVIEGTMDLGIIFSGLVVTALYGLAYEKAIWSIKFWKVFFWFISIFVGLALILSVAQLGSIESGADKAEAISQKPLYAKVIGFFLLMLVFVELRGLYLYVFRRHNIWAKQM